jgi:hypothetical protein
MFKKSDFYFLAAALLSLILSVVLWFGIDQDAGLYVAIWVPSILGFGIYFKIITRRN